MTLTATVLTLMLMKGGPMLPFADEISEVKVDGTPTVEVRALVRQVRISGAGAKAKGWKAHGACPRAHAEGTDLVLDCTTSRLHARVSFGKVSIYKLRGLPWAAKDEATPRFNFPPSRSVWAARARVRRPRARPSARWKDGRDAPDAP